MPLATTGRESSLDESSRTDLSPDPEERRPPRRTSARRDVVLYLAVLTGLVLAIGYGAQSLGYRWQWYRVSPMLLTVRDGHWVWGPLAMGAAATVKIVLWSLPLALSIGVAVAVLRSSGLIVGRALARIYLEVIRSTPLLVQLYLTYFVVAPVLGLDRYAVGILALAVFEGALASEIFRAGIAAVPSGQWEACASLGLSRFETYRSVVLPQALRIVMPPLTSLAVSLIKHSAIVSVIAVAELTTAGHNLVSETFMSFEVWFTVAAIYLVATTSLSTLAGRLEAKLQTPS